MNGLGLFKWADGRQYSGSWKDNQMHGQGVYTTADGDRYEGNF